MKQTDNKTLQVIGSRARLILREMDSPVLLPPGQLPQWIRSFLSEVATHASDEGDEALIKGEASIF
jgi:hypothetical protein